MVASMRGPPVRSPGPGTSMQRTPLLTARAAVAASFLVLGGGALWRSWGIDRTSLRGLLAAAVLGAAALLAVRIAQRLRGRDEPRATRGIPTGAARWPDRSAVQWADVLQPLIWLGPWHLAPLSALSLCFSLAASAGLVAWTCGWRAFTAALREGLERASADSLQSRLAWVLLVVLVWTSQVLMPGQIGDDGLDLSWSSGLNEALRRGLQHGTEIVFTMGPFGGLRTGVYDPELLWVKLLLFEGVFKLLLAVVLVHAGWRIRGALERTLYFLTLLALPMAHDSVYLLAALAAVALLLDRPGPSRLLLFSCTALLAVLSLAKFTLLPLSVAAVTVIGLAWGKGRSKGAALLVPACYAGWILVLWLLCQQSPANLPRYVAISMQVSTGYVEGQSLLATEENLNRALVLLGLFGALLLLHAATSLRRWPELAMAAVLAAATFMAFKLGFVRGLDHNPIFFAYAATAALLLAVPGEARVLARTRGGLRIACAVLGILGLAHYEDVGLGAANRFVGRGTARIFGNLVALDDFEAWREQRETGSRQVERRLALPDTRRIVGRQGIDMISFEQGLIFQNKLAWQPRPVFQSYITFTPDLLEANARFYESEAAPPFVLFHLQTIDQRLLTMDDGLVLQILARDYQPVLQEKDYLLMQRVRRSAPARDLPVVLERTVGFGEALDLSGLEEDCLVLTLDFELTARGRLHRFLYLAHPIFMRVRTVDGEAARVRVVPGMMRTGAILSPWINSQHRWLAWFTGAPTPRVASIELEAPDDAWIYRPTVGVRLLRGDPPVPVAPEEVLRRPMAGIFSHTPDHFEVAFPPSRQRLDQDEVVVMHAPSEMRFDLGAGEHVLECGFGLLPGAYRGGRGTDGASFRIVLRELGQPERVLLDRLLEPVTVVADQGTHSFRAAFRTERPAALYLSTGVGPRGNAARDWTYWSTVELSR